MRPIKFRAWDKEKKFMWQNVIVADETACLSVEDCDEENEADFTVKITNAILMQYTGLKDKNGKEIYEGDVIKFYADKLNGWKTYDVNYNGLNWRLGGKHSTWNFSSCLPADYHKLEIIGNIYENSEMLEKFPSNKHK